MPTLTFPASCNTYMAQSKIAAWRSNKIGEYCVTSTLGNALYDLIEQCTETKQIFSIIPVSNLCETLRMFIYLYPWGMMIELYKCPHLEYDTEHLTCFVLCCSPKQLELKKYLCFVSLQKKILHMTRTIKVQLVAMCCFQCCLTWIKSEAELWVCSCAVAAAHRLCWALEYESVKGIS